MNAPRHGSAITALPRDVLETLCLLDGAPPGVAEATLGLLPRETRALLVEKGVIEPVAGAPGEAVEITITEVGYSLIEDCAGPERAGFAGS
jgi:hypothetical protein